MRALSRAIVAVGLVLRLMAPAVAGPIDDGIAAGKRYVDGTDIAMKFISDHSDLLFAAANAAGCNLPNLASQLQARAGDIVGDFYKAANEDADTVMVAKAYFLGWYVAVSQLAGSKLQNEKIAWCAVAAKQADALLAK